LYLHYFIITFVVGISNFVTFGFHFLLKITHSNTKNELSNVNIIVYCLPSIEVCVHTCYIYIEDVMRHVSIDYLNSVV